MDLNVNVTFDLSPRLLRRLGDVQNQLETIMTQNDRIVTDVAAFKAALTKHAAKVQTQLQQVVDLITKQGQPSPEVEAALTELEAGVAQLGDLDTALDADDTIPA